MNCFVTGGRGGGRRRRRGGAQNECFWNNSDLVHLIWTKFGMDILIDPRNKPTEEFLIFLKIQDDGLRSKVQIDQIWPNKLHFGSAFGSGSSDLDNIWHGHTTLGTSLPILFTFLKILMAAGGQNLNFGWKITFRLGKCIPFIRFCQKLQIKIIVNKRERLNDLDGVFKI